MSRFTARRISSNHSPGEQKPLPKSIDPEILATATVTCSLGGSREMESCNQRLRLTGTSATSTQYRPTYCVTPRALSEKKPTLDGSKRIKLGYKRRPVACSTFLFLPLHLPLVCVRGSNTQQKACICHANLSVSLLPQKKDTMSAS